MSGNKYYYYLKSELNSIKFILIVIILLFIYLFFFFFCKKIFSIMHLRAWLKVVFWVTDSNQEWAVVLPNKLSL